MSRDVEDLLARLQADLPARRTPRGRVDTLGALADLAAAWPGPLRQQQRANLDALIRKVHLARRVLTEYELGWKPPATPEALGAAAWRLLVGVLVAFASSVSSRDALERSVAAKCLNAALVALDRSESQVVAGGELREWSDELLEELVGP
jgi:hypothetical protein